MAQIRFPSDLTPMFSGHETFPLRQLWLRKAYVQVTSQNATSPKGVFTDADAIERFGVGKNMVSSIRHWALACDVIRSSDTVKGEFRVGRIGAFLFGDGGCDPFLEHDATIWLVHWLLAGRAERSATWYVVFNFVQSQSFSLSDVLTLIEEYAAENKIGRCSSMTLRRDVEVCLRSYSALSKAVSEDSAEPLLSELSLLSFGARDSYHFNRGPQYSLPDEVFAFALLDFWQRRDKNNGGSQSTLSFNAIAHEYGSPGRVFKLDEDSVGDRLSRIFDVTKGALAWTDSAGIRQVSRVHNDDGEMMASILRGAYGR
ncbi:DUF4007 family protein [uncultured Herbaspirillum sp.]|uniref:DUF4007 family protein n=1 Tax=uncultured Herbaspirillum sp. TaxID=160236 RepID=UPI0026383632|nr:DUF4007 family protein [uncultured Herbaspirillum sp.]